MVQIPCRSSVNRLPVRPVAVTVTPSSTRPEIHTANTATYLTAVHWRVLSSNVNRGCAFLLFSRFNDTRLHGRTAERYAPVQFTEINQNGAPVAGRKVR